MDLSLLTLPSLSPLGSRNTAKFQPIATAKNVYCRQAIVLPLSVNIWDSVPTKPDVTEQSFWVPQTEIDIKTALAEGCPVAFNMDEVNDPCIATLIGYNTETRLFIVRDGEECFNISFDFVLDPNLASDFWTVQ